MIYVQIKNGPRIPLDEKSTLHFEGTEFSLVGSSLAVYDVTWFVDDGFLGTPPDTLPAKILRVDDPFCGITIEIPLLHTIVNQVANALKIPKKRKLPLGF